MDQNTHDHAIKVRRLHEIYIGLMLAATIVILLTYRFADNEKVTDYISFALTVSSILLALVAIGITVAGNATLDRHFGTLDKTNYDLRQSSEAVRLAALDVTQRMQGVSVLLNDVGSTASRTHDRVEEMYRKNADATPAAAALETSERRPADTLDFSKFWRVSSWNGKVVLYAAAKLGEAGSWLDIESYAKAAYLRRHEEQSNYVHGYLVATTAAGLMSSKNDKYQTKAAICWTAQQMKDSLLKIIADAEKRETSSGGISSTPLTVRRQEHIDRVDAYISFLLADAEGAPEPKAD